MEAGIENVRMAKSLEDLEDSVHPTTMESMETYCKRKDRKNEEKMLIAMVSSYDGKVRGGEIGGGKTAKLIGFVMEAGIENVRVAKSLEDLKDCVYETTMESMMKYCFDVNDNNEEKMLNALISSYEGRVRGGEIGGKIGGKIGGEKTAKLFIFVNETGVENVRVAKSLADLECYVHPTTMESMAKYCADVHKRDEKKMLNAMVSSYDNQQSNAKKGSDIRWMRNQIK
eukprot:scaffold1626_cov178-Alexandrium_tamarense.AAC.14